MDQNEFETAVELPTQGVDVRYLEPTYTRETDVEEIFQGLLFNKYDFAKDFDLTKEGLFYLPKRFVAGNHKHPRVEAMIGFGDLEFAYIDKYGKLQRMPMYIDQQLALITVSAHIPHAVKNNSETQFGMLLEFAREPQHDVEKVQVF